MNAFRAVKADFLTETPPLRVPSRDVALASMLADPEQVSVHEQVVDPMVYRAASELIRLDARAKNRAAGAAIDQLVQLHLEHNKPLGETNWNLPRIEVTTAKSVRGFVGVSADAGFRLTPGRTSALTDTPTAFFPRKVAGIQSAFRLNDPAWQATMQVERMPQTVQADAFHLFSIGEGVAESARPNP